MASKSSRDFYRDPSVIAFVFFISTLSMRPAIADFWFEDFTDNSLNDSGIEWLFVQDHFVEPDGLLASTEAIHPAAGASPNWPADTQSWSIRTKGRLLQSHGFFGAGTTIRPGQTVNEATWNGVTPDGYIALGSFGPARNQISAAMETNLRPAEEDVIVQLDTFDGVMRMWAWRDGEQPEEDIAPLIEESFHLPVSAPYIWTRSDDGPSSAMFRWAAFSTEHLPVNLPVSPSDLIGDMNNDDILDAVDLEMLVDAIRSEGKHLGMDLDQNGIIEIEDYKHWVTDIKRTWFGDANLDGEFNSADLVGVFQTGFYETGETASWSQGDWTGDGLFDSTDFVAAFQDGGYEIGPRVEVHGVPETNSNCLVVLGIVQVLSFARRHHASDS